MLAAAVLGTSSPQPGWVRLGSLKMRPPSPGWEFRKSDMSGDSAGLWAVLPAAQAAATVQAMFQVKEAAKAVRDLDETGAPAAPAN